MSHIHNPLPFRRYLICEWPLCRVFNMKYVSEKNSDKRFSWNVDQGCPPTRFESLLNLLSRFREPLRRAGGSWWRHFRSKCIDSLGLSGYEYWLLAQVVSDVVQKRCYDRRSYGGGGQWLYMGLRSIALALKAASVAILFLCNSCAYLNNPSDGFKVTGSAWLEPICWGYIQSGFRRVTANKKPTIRWD